jgi:hypothetical protein
LTQQFQIRTNIFPDDDDFKNIFFSPKETWMWIDSLL